MSYIPAMFVDGVLTLTDDGGHSATLQLSDGTMSLSDLWNEGREVVDVQSRGHWVGTRLGARVFPTLTINATLSSPSDALHLMVLGKTAGFVSTALSLGDAPHVDGSWVFDYGAEARSITFDDANGTISITEGSPSTVSITLTIKGPLEIDGTSIITAR
jgi:hypothetical protein